MKAKTTLELASELNTSGLTIDHLFSPSGKLYFTCLLMSYNSPISFLQLDWGKVHSCLQG
jgi:hypothetical protein